MAKAERANKSNKGKFDPDAQIVSGEEGLANLGRMFKRVVSVSNKAVQEKMTVEKRKRQTKRKVRR